MAPGRFYTGLFGWDTEDTPIPEGGVYTMLSKGGKNVAGPIRRAGEGQPSAWNSYVTVESADASAAAAKEHGGTLGDGSLRRHGRRADGGHPGSDGRVLRGLGAAREHRRASA